MATLRHEQSDRLQPLSARLLVGRGPSCALRLDDRRVSGEHATLVWTGQRWEIRDLGSRNGTFVDGVRLEPGRPQPLESGVRIGFGRDDDPWQLVDAGPPRAVARELRGGELVAAEGRLLALPSPEQPEVVVFEDARGRWVLERDDDELPVRDGEVIQVAGRSWQLGLPALHEGTATVDQGPSVDTLRLRFGVSLDEEHVQITVLHRGREIRLEPREHGYVLLTLARQRLEDRELPLPEQGWIDREALLRMLQVDPNGLNVAIYRARNQLAAAGVEGAAELVQVRRGQRRLGIEPDRLEVGPLERW